MKLIFSFIYMVIVSLLHLIEYAWFKLVCVVWVCYCLVVQVEFTGFYFLAPLVAVGGAGLEPEFFQTLGYLFCSLDIFRLITVPSGGCHALGTTSFIFSLFISWILIAITSPMFTLCRLAPPWTQQIHAANTIDSNFRSIKTPKSIPKSTLNKAHLLLARSHRISPMHIREELARFKIARSFDIWFSTRDLVIQLDLSRFSVHLLPAWISLLSLEEVLVCEAELVGELEVLLCAATYPLTIGLYVVRCHNKWID